MIFAFEVIANNGTWAKASKRFPYDITLISASADNSLNEVSRLLATVKAGELVTHAVSLTLNTLNSRNLRAVPDIGHANFAFEFDAKLCPLRGTNGIFAVDAEVGATVRPSVLVRIACQFLKRVWRRIIPEVIGRQILTRCGIQNLTCVIG